MSPFYLETEDILNITGQRFYRRGVDLYNKGRVIKLSYNQVINSWSATVKGGSQYQVRIFFFDDDDLEAKCDCPAYRTHFTCKHIAAVLLAISKHHLQKEILTEQTSTNLTDPFPLRMIEMFEAEQTDLAAKEKKLKFNYQLLEKRHNYNQDSIYKISLKIGENQLFIVKDLPAFIKAIDLNQTYKITETFSYKPKEHLIGATDLELLTLIKQAVTQTELYSIDFLASDKREITLPPFMIQTFFDKIKTQSFQLIKENNETTTELNLHKQLPNITFPIEVNKDQSFTINFKDLFTYHFSSYYQYLNRDNDFYFLSTEQKNTLAQIYAILPYRQKNLYQISKNKMSYFIGYVLPKLKSIGEVAFSQEAEHTIEKVPLEIKLYLETQKEALSLAVIFQYGKKKVYPHQTTNDDEQVLIRDFQAEQLMLNKLKDSGFRYLNQSYWLFNEERIYNFIYHLLPELEKEATIYLTDQVKALKTDKPYQLQTNIEVNAFTGMLDVHFNMDGISEQDIQEVLQALIEKKSYHRLTDGGLIELKDQSFQNFQALADQLHLKKRDLEQASLELSPARSIQIDHALTEKQTRYSETFKQLLETLNTPQTVDYQIPDTLNASLRDYQVIGFQWFKSLARYQLGGILADEMGLGKTIQAISFILSEKDIEQKWPTLIIAPASLIYNWKKEFEKFAPTLNVDVIVGTKVERKAKINTTQKSDVWITSYPLIRQDIDLYKSIHFDVMILDEAQAIKNHLTQTAKATRQIHAKQHFALSGTPIENRLEELWSIFQTLSPGFLGSKKQFIQYQNDYIKQITKPFILRRLKTDVLPDLPDKIEFEQYSDLTKEQKQVYLAYLERMQQQLNTVIEADQFEQEKLEILTALTRLRQICCHPRLFLENYQEGSGKLELLMTIIEQLRVDNRRILIFSQFSSMLKIIQEELEKQNYQAFYLDGQTPIKNRVDMADAFNNGEREIFIISLKAGGTGLNLTGADTVILFDLWWNPAVEEQAAGRAHRIGQTKKVEVIRLITEGTIEEKIFQLQEKKRKLVDEIIQPGETLLSSLNKDEIKDLLSFER
ncbi:SNF2 helicase associated domain-containing protein [Amphibacillus sp. Q70]|uniref:SNF2 helicase associated domain-containing protein n=1 Tax=Amphibacillus sp. Q70 TaxID=3453416 RepID=UPI003F854723